MEMNTETSKQLMALLAVCFLDTVVLAYIILRSRWAGWRLTATVFFVFYGVMTFISQIESAIFHFLPPGMLPRLFLMGVLIAAPFSPLAVIILGKRKADTATINAPNARSLMPANEWAWKVAIIAIAYMILYSTFGYFIAWRNPAVQQFYGGIDEGSFFAHMNTVLTSTPWFLPFQALRAMLWALLALPVIRMMKGHWQETAIAVGLLFAVLMNSQLLLPNPIMPEAVRMTHLVETAPYNFIFGCLIVWLLHRHHSSLSDLFRAGVDPTVKTGLIPLAPDKGGALPALSEKRPQTADPSDVK
jgi:hypothetical protein